MHTIVQGEWSGGTARVQSECAHAFRPKFELSNSSHALKQKNHLRCTQSFKVNGPAAPYAKFPSTFQIFLAYHKNIYLRPTLPHPLFSPTTSHISPVSSFLSYSRFLACFLALTVSHPTVEVAMVFFKDLSSGSSFEDDSTTRVCLSSLSQAMTWNEGFLPSGRFEPFLPLVAPKDHQWQRMEQGG